MARIVAKEGRAFKIEYARRLDGSSPAHEFVSSLSTSDQAKILALFNYLAEVGRIANDQKFKKVQDELWEFKSFQIRMLCRFSADSTVVVSHGFIKKSPKTPPSEILHARNILREDNELHGRKQEKNGRSGKRIHPIPR